MANALNLGIRSISQHSPLIAGDIVYAATRSDLVELREGYELERNLFEPAELFELSGSGRPAQFTYTHRYEELTRYLVDDIKQRTKRGAASLPLIGAEILVPTVVDDIGVHRRIAIPRSALSPSLRYFHQPQLGVLEDSEFVGAIATYHLTTSIGRAEGYDKKLKDVFWPTLSETVGQIPEHYIKRYGRIYFSTIPVHDDNGEQLVLGLNDDFQVGLTILMSDKK